MYKFQLIPQQTRSKKSLYRHCYHLINTHLTRAVRKRLLQMKKNSFFSMNIGKEIEQIFSNLDKQYSLSYVDSFYCEISGAFGLIRLHKKL
jgi:hypothetical protein